MAAITLTPRLDGSSSGPWQVQGALTRSAALGSVSVSDTRYVWTDKAYGGMFFVMKLGPPKNVQKIKVRGPRWIDIRLKRLSGNAYATLKIALFQGDPRQGSLVHETREVGFRDNWHTCRIKLKPNEAQAITNYKNLWIRIRIVRAQEVGSLGISRVSFKVPDEERNWQPSSGVQPAPPSQIAILTGDDEEYEGIKYDGEWSFDDDSAFESPTRYVKFWSAPIPTDD